MMLEEIKYCNSVVPSTAEFIVQTNLATDVSLLGVAKGEIRSDKSSSWRDTYLAFYQLKDGRKLKMEINEELYHALHSVFDTILEIHS